jgi:hypothetical protein
LCGNTLDPDALTTLLGEDRAAMVFTDPPYNVPIDGHASGLGAIHHRSFPMASGEIAVGLAVRLRAASGGRRPRCTAAAPGSGTCPAPAPVAEPMPGDRWVSIQGATCERLLELSPDDRAAASLFYTGYQAARFRRRAINVGAIPDAEAWAYNYCVEHPGRPAVEAFRQAYLQTLR